MFILYMFIFTHKLCTLQKSGGEMGTLTFQIPWPGIGQAAYIFSNRLKMT